MHLKYRSRKIKYIQKKTNRQITIFYLLIYSVMWFKKIVKNYLWCLFIIANFTLGATDFDLQPLGKLSQIDVRLQKGTLFGVGQVRGSFERVRGGIQFSTKSPSKTVGSVYLDARALHFGYHKVDGDAHQPRWLNSMKYPKIIFQLAGLRNAHWKDEILYADAFGTLRLKNKTSPITFPATIKYLRNARKKYDRKPGDLIILKGQLPLSRGDFGINPGSMLDVIQDGIIVNVNLVGCSSGKRPLLPSRLFF